jgi:hypothetical protein
MQQNHGVIARSKRNKERVNMEQKQNNTQTLEVVSYPKDKIQLLFNILNSMSFIGIQQAQGIAQISVILNNPIVEDKTENVTKESQNNEVK